MPMQHVRLGPISVKYVFKHGDALKICDEIVVSWAAAAIYVCIL